jgi:hypothetical protein
MAEWRRTDEAGLPVFDDDRLLALALGLDDDPELEAAAERDEALRRRLDEMRADVAAVGAQLDAVVPAPGEGYADPADARWAGLRDYLAVPPARAARSRSSRWLRVLAPAAAVAVALAVGVGVLTSQTGPARDQTTTSFEEGAAGAESDRQPAATSSTLGGSQDSSAGGERKDLETQQLHALAKQAEGFAVVVVAQASTVEGELQRFTVVRTLKGDAPAVVRLGIVSRAAQVGGLHVLFLDPVASPSSPPDERATPAAGGEAAPDGSASPEPDEARDAAGAASPGVLAEPSPVGEARPRPVAFRFEGAEAIVTRLPAGLDPATLRLP